MRKRILGEGWFTVAQPTWEQPKEGSGYIEEVVAIVIAEKPRIRLQPERRVGIGEEPMWTEEQRRFLERLIDDIQVRQDDRDKEILNVIRTQQDRRHRFIVFVNGMLNALWQAVRG
jgi:hypothetical protein